MSRKVIAMPIPVPVITSMQFGHAEKAGYTVHAETTAGPMDITMTVAQYHGVRAQLADQGRATIPTHGSAAA